MLKYVPVFSCEEMQRCSSKCTGTKWEEANCWYCYFVQQFPLFVKINNYHSSKEKDEMLLTRLLALVIFKHTSCEHIGININQRLLAQV
jgi:hypothetical protein